MLDLLGFVGVSLPWGPRPTHATQLPKATGTPGGSLESCQDGTHPEIWTDTIVHSGLIHNSPKPTTQCHQDMDKQAKETQFSNKKG